MKKILILSLLFVGITARVYADDAMLKLKNQRLDEEIARLTAERDKKYNELKQCEKTTKGFKIAGISTLVGTGVGLIANVKLSKDIGGSSSSGKMAAKPGEDPCATGNENDNEWCKWERDCAPGGLYANFFQPGWVCNNNDVKDSNFLCCTVRECKCDHTKTYPKDNQN